MSAIPYYYNGPMARAAVEAGCHFSDLGGNTEIVFEQKKLHDAALAKGVSVIPDCGLAPGMVNILAAEGIRRLDHAEQVKIYVGGLPQHPEPPLNYQIVYSLEGALDYYTTPSWVLRGGKPVQVDALSELEAVEFPQPVGTLEAFHTGGGISTLPFAYEGKIDVMEYKTLRYPGHVAIMRPIRELGLLDLKPVEVKGKKVVPRDVFIAAVHPKLHKPKGQDLVALQVMVTGSRAGKPARVVVPPDRPLRRRARHQRHDADDRLLALDHRPDAGRRPGDAQGRPHARRGDPVRGLRGGAGPARRPDRGALRRGADICVYCFTSSASGEDAGFQDLWDKGLTFEAFVAACTQAQGLWEGIYKIARVPEWALTAVPSGASRKLLVIAEDWCGDASNTVPVIARLATWPRAWSCGSSSAMPTPR